MNKKGDMPTILLFVITLLLVVLALLSFVSFNSSFTKESEERSKMIENIALYQDYIIKESEIIAKNVLYLQAAVKENELKDKFKSEAEKENLQIQEFSNFFEKIKNGDFEFYNENTDYVLKITNLKVTSSEGANSFARTLSFIITFDKDGNTKIYK